MIAAIFHTVPVAVKFLHLSKTLELELAMWNEVCLQDSC